MKNDNGVEKVLTVGCEELERSECAILGEDVEVRTEAASMLTWCLHQRRLAPSCWGRLPQLVW
jgi:hypothetical protein